MLGLKLLVLDDDDVIRENMLAYLEDEGFNVTGCSSGEYALNLLKKQCFDAGIIDMRLPGIDGSEFIIKAHNINSKMRFVIHAGTTNFVLSDELKNIGIKSKQVLLKPVKNMEDIIYTLKIVMED
ncbi:MAG: response regulator [Candidatus Muirbacterium halophilum]|nr:response regulator [Candidatus Muirbacterium halophilum]